MPNNKRATREALTPLLLSLHRTSIPRRTRRKTHEIADTNAPTSPQRRAYKLREWADHEDFLHQLAKASGRLLRGGEPDLNTAARMVLYDWQRGKIPYFTLPPGYTDEAPPARVSSKAAAAIAAAEEADEEAAGEDDDEEGGGGGAALALGVTEEDAKAEAGANPVQAAAAARAVARLAQEALAEQRRTAIPVQRDYFLPGDERLAGDDEPVAYQQDDAVDHDAVSDDDDEEEEDDNDNSGGEGSAGSQDGDDASGSSGSGDGDGGDGDESDESDGYGEGGLSWEAVLQALQVRRAPLPRLQQQQQQHKRHCLQRRHPCSAQSIQPCHVMPACVVACARIPTSHSVPGGPWP